MPRSEHEDALNAVVKATAERLAPMGFRHRGLALRLVGDDMCGLIQFQRSVTNTRERLAFTVNVGVVCGPLLPSRISLAEARITDAHALVRLGELAHEHDDKWWTIDGSTNAAELAKEIADSVQHSAAPFIRRHMSPAALIRLWETNRSFGLTDMQRQELLKALRAKLGNP